MTATTIRFAEPGEDGTCRFCGDQVIRNYDGAGTGWSHIYDEGDPLWLRSGTKQCREFEDPEAGHEQHDKQVVFAGAPGTGMAMQCLTCGVELWSSIRVLEPWEVI